MLDNISSIKIGVPKEVYEQYQCQNGTLGEISDILSQHPELNISLTFFKLGSRLTTSIHAVCKLNEGIDLKDLFGINGREKITNLYNMLKVPNLRLDLYFLDNSSAIIGQVFPKFPSGINIVSCFDAQHQPHHRDVDPQTAQLVVDFLACHALKLDGKNYPRPGKKRPVFFNMNYVPTVQI